uniref:Uncharacterized protein n=1 Tax=Arundo donax TaxID=35708 RepID=A0A0A8YHE2_ARUDO
MTKGKVKCNPNQTISSHRPIRSFQKFGKEDLQ